MRHVMYYISLRENVRHKSSCWSFKLIVTWMFDVSPDSVDTETSVSRDLNSEWHMEADTSMSFTLLSFSSSTPFPSTLYRRHKREANQFSSVSIDSTSRWVTHVREQVMGWMDAKLFQNFWNVHVYTVVSNFWNSPYLQCNVIFH